jgi:hypothetical protein
MPPVSVIKIPEEHRATPDQELLISIGLQASLWSSTEDAKKLRDALCIMLGRPGKAGKAR